MSLSVLSWPVRIAALACVAVLFAPRPAAAAPAAAESAPLKVAPIAYTERRLANGLQVIAAPNSASPTVSVQVWYHVGSKDDPPGRSGFAHLFEHLMFKSTRYLKNEQFDRLTEDVGGSNNAFTSDDVTAYQDEVPSNHLEVLLWAEAERMANLAVVDESFQSERSVVKEEYRQRVLASPFGLFSNALSSRPYLVHPYQRPGIGSIADLDAATLADVVAFHRTYYRPDNATLVVAGDFEPTQLNAWVDRYFGPLTHPAEPIPRVTATEPPWTADRHIVIAGPRVPLPAVGLVWLAPPVTHADTAPLQVVSALLSGGESSRLHQSLVYRQRIASQAGFEADFRVGPGLLSAYAMAAGTQTLDRLSAALLAELQRLARQPVPPAELAKVKTQMLTQALASRQTPNGLASALADAAVLEGDAAQADRALAALQAVTAADVRRVVQQYLLQPHRVRLDYTQAAGPQKGTP